MQMQQRQDHKMKMPSRVDLTLAELQEMAARQQQQIEQQQEVLVAKEQRLKFLKQQEQRHLQIAGENERLRRLRERVEVQEAKLKKLRALRGEATSQVNSNVTLASELEAIKTLFHEKEKELASAVRKVDQLTRQLDELRKQKPTNGSSSAPAHNGQASSELEKLRKELVMYNVLNEEQNSKLASHRELLQQRKEEMMHLDEKIAELQSRFKMKPLPLSLRKDDNKTGRQGRPLSNNVAAVEPYVKHPPKDSDDELNKEMMQPLTKQDPKYQTLPHNLKFKDNGMKKAKDEVADAKQLNKSASVGKLGSSEPGFKTTAPSSSQMATSKQVPPSYSSVMGLAAKQGSQSSFISKDMPPPPSSSAGIPVTIAVMTPSTRVTSLMTNFVPRPYGSSYSSSVLGTRPVPSSVSDTSVLSTPNTSVSLPKTSTPVTSSQDQRPGFGASQPSTYVPPASLQNTYSTSSSRISTSAPPAKIATPGSSHMTHSSGSTMFGVSHSGSSYSVSGESSQNVMNQTTTTTSAPKTPIYASKSVIANTYMRKLGPTAMEKYRNSMSQIYQGFPSSQVGGSDGLKSDQTDRSMTATVAPMGKHNEQRSNQSNEIRNMVSLKQQQFEISEEKSEGDAAPYGRDPPPYNIDPVKFRPNAPRPHRRRSSSGDSPRTEDKVHAPRVPTPHSLLEDDVFGNKEEADGSKMLTKPSGVLQSEQGNQQSFKEPASPKEKQPRDHSERLPLALRRKGNLKSKDSTKSSRRVSFDPLALLLDASLEGELDLVKKTAQEVPDPSCPNDEGITALHNAICAGHFEIVKFLVEFGCNVNAPDSDGWTPLHCAASCNNLPMVKVLVEHGACIFATTISDHETAAEKCEEDEDGYDGCSEYLYNIQEKLGVLNNGVVYAVFDYRAQNSDELDFNTQDKLTVLRKGDETEQEWWWAKKDNREGYIPRNLLGLYPRVQPQWLKDK